MRLRFFATLLVVQQTVADSIGGWGTQFFEQAIIAVPPYLYVVGGESYKYNGLIYGAVSDVILNTTEAIDLRGTWTNSTVGVAVNPTPPNFQLVSRPVLFHDPVNNDVGIYGGQPYGVNAYTSSLWTFPAGGSFPNWTSAQTPNTNQQSATSLAPAGAAYAQSNQELFVLGGWVLETLFVSLQYIPGLVRYDFSTKKWSNETVNIPGSTGFIAEAQAAFAPNFGASGYLVVVGGVTAPSTVWNVSIYDFYNSPYNSMATITLYDVAAKTWYTQTATGDIPPPRVKFCSVGLPSADNTTFEMFVYGGGTNSTYDADIPDSEGYLDVYVLSLPAFRWFKTKPSSGFRRWRHSCAIVGQSQMISVGGQPVSSRNPAGQDVDPWTGLGIFDLNNLTWSDHYDAIAPAYQRAEVVNTYYSNNCTTPNFSSPSLASTFTCPRISGTSTDGSNSTDTSGSNKGHSGNHTAAIAGGVVGGVLGLLLVGGLYYGFRPHKKGKRKAAMLRDIKTPIVPSTEPEMTQNELASNPRYEVASNSRYEVYGDSAVSPSYRKSLSESNKARDKTSRAELPTERDTN